MVDVRPGDFIRVVKKGGLVVEGVVLPSTEFTSEKHLVVKLSNGYNIGISLDDAVIEVLAEKYTKPVVSEEFREMSIVRGSGSLKIGFVSTGGTIVSKVEYETGAVKPALSASDLVEFAPDFRELSSELVVVDFMRKLSENMTPEDWSHISEEVGRHLKAGVDGVVVAHGTDTMSYTAAALAFSLRNLGNPVLLVGAQRSSDRPSTDALYNLKACPIVVRDAPFAEVAVVMHGTTDDLYALVHRGVRVRKMHSSRRDAFQSINDIPLARVYIRERRFELLNRRFLPRTRSSDIYVLNKFSNKVSVVKSYPGIDCEIFDYLADRGYRGVVIEGTGLGHVREECVESIKRATDSGVVVAMATQTIFGRVDLDVYTTGRKLLKAGVVPVDDMVPEVAFVKLSWLLGNFPEDGPAEIKLKLVSNMANEIGNSQSLEVFPRWYHGD
ncbi:MAG: Glu-tRNA(Gln) amidotransferase subunit GatD [Sulfolobales archaeon]|nr:Glu-tRNA(Gln) amidotransferase subunit GatD [Sulfolobales archaeon]MDW8083504.1 Glu-tRNA(Gln) amidotransferase subunit GatD [Sulfolobales archaeon]